MTVRSKDWFVQAERDLEQAKSSQKEKKILILFPGGAIWQPTL